MPSEAPLAGRRALVTAASSGIGRATAALLVSQGAATFITGTSDRTAEVAGAIGARGHALADFSVPGAAAAAADAAREQLGGIDILVVNTGGPRPGAFDSFGEDDWLGAYHLILGSAIALTRAVVPQMESGGRVIYLTSTAGIVKPLPGLHLSNVMRAGVGALSASLVGEYGPRGITFNVIAPGPIDTPRRRQIMAFQAQARGMEVDAVAAEEDAVVPARRMGSAEEVAELVAYLASPRAGYITGAVHVIDGGLTVS